VSGQPADFKKGRCFVNPLKKQLVCQHSDALSFAADTAVIMLHYKLLDNIRDGGIFSKLGGGIMGPAVRAAHRKASRTQPKCDEIISAAMERQTELERRLCDSVDEAAQPTADALGAICVLLSEDPDKRRILERLGYFVGRYVYLCDALDDLEKDIATGNYNPFALRYGLTGKSGLVEAEKNSLVKQAESSGELDRVRTQAKESLYATIAECAKAYDLLCPGPFHPVLDNIFQMGMQGSVGEILSKKEKHK